MLDLFGPVWSLLHIPRCLPLGLLGRMVVIASQGIVGLLRGIC